MGVMQHGNGETKAIACNETAERLEKNLWVALSANAVSLIIAADRLKDA